MATWLMRLLVLFAKVENISTLFLAHATLVRPTVSAVFLTNHQAMRFALIAQKDIFF